MSECFSRWADLVGVEIFWVAPNNQGECQRGKVKPNHQVLKDQEQRKPQT